MNPHAKRIAREYQLLLLRAVLRDVPRLLRAKRRALRRGESVEAINAEAQQLQQELKQKRQLYITVRNADAMLRRAGWH